MDEIKLIPEADPEAFVEDVENNYTDDRYSRVSEMWHDDVPRVIVNSGEHPAYTRFIKDMRKYLYRHGFVLWTAKEDSIIACADGEGLVHRHQVIGVPIAWVIAEMNCYVCRTGSCMNLIGSWDSQYCESCSEIGLDDEKPGDYWETIYA